MLHCFQAFKSAQKLSPECPYDKKIGISSTVCDVLCTWYSIELCLLLSVLPCVCLMSVSRICEVLVKKIMWREQTIWVSQEKQNWNNRSFSFCCWGSGKVFLSIFSLHKFSPDSAVPQRALVFSAYSVDLVIKGTKTRGACVLHRHWGLGKISILVVWVPDLWSV